MRFYSPQRNYTDGKTASTPFEALLRDYVSCFSLTALSLFFVIISHPSFQEMNPEQRGAI